MQAHDFNSIVEAQLQTCTNMLVRKADEYADDSDRLHNFKEAAALEEGCTPREALAGMMRKHTVSIYDMCYSKKTYTMAQWDEKITDHLNYLLLLKACVVEELVKDGNPVFLTETPDV